MTPFIEYVRNGTIGALFLGISKPETLGRLGEPKNWLGRPPVVGRAHRTYERSDVWFYYNDSVGIRFGPEGTAVATLLYPEMLSGCPELFKEWPVTSNFKMGNWRYALLVNKIKFVESQRQSLNYWIVAEEACLAYGFPFENGRALHGYDRLVKILTRFEDKDLMRQRCEFLAM